MTQTEQIEDYLRRGHTLTALSALRLFGCLRLAARIADLRAVRVAVKAKRVRLPSGKSVAQYSL